MKTAIVIGSARCWEDDYAAAMAIVGQHDVIAVNDIATVYEGVIAAVASLHGEKLARWLAERETKGYPKPRHVITGLSAGDDPHVRTVATDVVEAKFDSQEHGGSSGLFAAKVALIDLGYDRVVLCGVPMTEEGGHFTAPDQAWTTATSYWIGWQEALPELKGKAFSMSGYTKQLLGEPADG